MASAVSSKSSSDGRRAWAPEAGGEQQPLCSPLTPRLPETYLSYFLKLWMSPLPSPSSPIHAGGPLLQLSICKLRAGTGSHVELRVCPPREHGAPGFHKEALDPSLPAQPRRLHIPCLRLEPSPLHTPPWASCSLDRALISVLPLAGLSSLTR